MTDTDIDTAYRVPTTIRGVTYPSQSAAARALGVARQVVFQASERGTLDHVGLGRSYWKRKRIYLDGVPFGSQKDLSLHLGKNIGTVSGIVLRAKRAGKTSVTRPFGTITWE